MTFELINIETTNTLAAFDEQHEALEEYQSVCAEDRSHRDAYIVIEFDDQGEACGVVAGPQTAVDRFAHA